MSGWELGVFETTRGGGAPPGGLPLHYTALHCPALNSTSAVRTCCSHRAERRRSVEPGLWEDDEGTPQPGRRQRTPCHARDAERERPMPLRPLRDFLNSRGETLRLGGFKDVPPRWDSVSRHLCAPVGINVSDRSLRPRQGIRGLLRSGGMQHFWGCGGMLESLASWLRRARSRLSPRGDISVASTPPLGSTRACGVPRHARPTVYFINRVERDSKHAEKTRRGASIPANCVQATGSPTFAPLPDRSHIASVIESRGLLLSAWLILSAALPTGEITEIMRLMCDQARVIVWPKCWREK